MKKHSEIKTHTFPNGFRLVYEESTMGAPLASIMGFVNVGSLEEPINIKGAAHFIEHMCFKGTKKETTHTINKQYDKIGAFFNASTHHEHTCYIVKCNEEYLKQCIHIFSDMMMNSTFKKRMYDLEKNVVVEEVLLSSSKPETIVDKLLQQLLYKGSAYELDVDEQKYHSSPNCLPYDDVLDFYDDWYQPQNMVLSVVSRIPFETIKKLLVGTYYMVKPGAMRKQYCVNTRVSPQDTIRIITEPHAGTHQLHIGIGFRTCPYDNKDKYTLAFLANIIGGSMGSRLFTLLREKNGLSYTSKCNIQNYIHTGHINIVTAIDQQKILKNGKYAGALPLLIGLLNKLHKFGVNKEEVDIFRGFIEGNIIRNLENSSIQCAYNGFHIMKYGERDLVPYHKQFETFYKDITISEINAIIKKYFKKENMTVVIVGNVKYLPSLDVIAHVCNKFIG